jgi:hypothetical protein
MEDLFEANGGAIPGATALRLRALSPRGSWRRNAARPVPFRRPTPRPEDNSEVSVAAQGSGLRAGGPLSKPWKKQNDLISRSLLAVVVSAFSMLEDILRPKSFAGLFGAAPSVALATPGIAVYLPRHGPTAPQAAGTARTTRYSTRARALAARSGSVFHERAPAI